MNLYVDCPVCLGKPVIPVEGVANVATTTKRHRPAINSTCHRCEGQRVVPLTQENCTHEWVAFWGKVPDHRCRYCGKVER